MKRRFMLMTAWLLVGALIPTLIPPAPLASELIEPPAADGDWSLVVPPTGRTDHTAVYDPVRSRMLVFGGYQSNAPNYLNDVWALSLDGSPAWTQLTASGTPPSPRRNHAAIYDPIRDRMVVFGGLSGVPPSYRNDVWALSLGENPAWTQLTPSGTPPSSRRGHAATYDPIRDRMVVCGGFSSIVPTYRNDAWALSLSGTPAWTQLTPSGTPPAGRTEHTAIYDAALDRLVIFGGTDGTYRNDVWELSFGTGPAWTEIVPSGAPPSGRSEHTAIYDPEHNQMVVFGEMNEHLTLLNEVWALSLAGTATWSELVPIGTRAAGRWGHTAIYDPIQGRMIVAGGSPNFANDVWEFPLDASPAWTELPPLDTAPAGRWFHATIYDPIRDRIVVCGGYPSNAFDVWTVNMGGQPAWTRLAPSGTPPSGRKNHTAIYDPVRDRIIVFGGFLTYPDDPLIDLSLNDSWALSLGESPTWTELFPGGTLPSKRFGHVAIYDPVRDRMLMFSGYPSFGSDVWALSLGTTLAWTKLTPTGTPPVGRYRHTAIYDPIRDRMIMFGGYKGDYSCVNDTWGLSLAGTPTWTQLAPAGTPPTPRGRHSAIFDPVQDRMVVFGAYDCDYVYLNDSWALSLAGTPAWTLLSPTGTIPSGRSGHSAIYDPVRDRMVLFGGGGNTQTNDVWSLTWGAASCAVPHVVSYNPSLVNSSNCAGGCTVNFVVDTQDDYSGVTKIILERYLEGMWVPEDSVLAPLPVPAWLLACDIDKHFTDGQHVFRAVFHCADGSTGVSETATVIADRGVPVGIQGFEGEYFGDGIALHWNVKQGVVFEGFNIYRSSWGDNGFERINAALIPADQGGNYYDRHVNPGRTYWYRLGAVDDEGEWMSEMVSIEVPKAALALHQNVPNPFNPTTTISFVLPERTRAVLAIYDVEGRYVRTLVDEVLSGGLNEAVWDGRDARGNPVSSGVYLYRLHVGNQTATKKLTILR